MPRSRPRPAPLPLALVHHANQYLVTDGYQDREGLTSIVTGYAALLKLHEKYRTPVALHLSGTMVEAVAWHHPWFLADVRRLRDVGLLSLVGGTYSENVLTAFDPEFNRRQLHELFWLYRRHLGCAPEDLEICWIPERVWDTDRLAGVLTDPTLPNGGYRYVLLDDRLLYPTDGAHGGSDRADFDGADPASPPPADALRPYCIEGGDGLQVVPMSTRLRYWIPPDDRRHWRSLSRTAELPTAPGDDTVLRVRRRHGEERRGGPVAPQCPRPVRGVPALAGHPAEPGTGGSAVVAPPAPTGPRHPRRRARHFRGAGPGLARGGGLPGLGPGPGLAPVPGAPRPGPPRRGRTRKVRAPNRG